MNTSSAIYVRDVVKNYGDNTILDGFSMTVERGTIYGLLGSSGCGKTTLLSCIVGRKSIKSGEIWVLGAPKGNDVLGSKVGYMPQELALVEEFTVRDAIYYFGTIFNMTNKEINDRVTDLTNLLDLPPEDSFLKNCSGGQKRRVSLAAALVHNPELIILDEPTVGVDPILREKIWDYLKDQVAINKITVIITTHYIEETREANRIGLMRGGKLLIEGSPTKLLASYQRDTLEEVYLILSQGQERDENRTLNNDISTQNDQFSVSTATSVESFAVGYGSQDELTKSSNKTKAKIKGRYKSTLNLNRNRLKALLDKSWKQIYRNIGVMTYLFTFPLMQTWFFINSVGRDPSNFNFGIVNNESFNTLCQNFSVNETAVLRDYDCHLKDLTCLYLTYLKPPMINKILYGSLEEAVNGIKHGDIIGTLYIPSNFTESFEQRIRMGKDAEKWLTDFGEIKVYMDMSNRLLGPFLENKLRRFFVDFQKKLLDDCNMSKKLAGVPIQLHFLYLEDEQSLIYFFIPGMLLMLVYLLGSTMTANIIVKEKLEGVWDRSIIAGVSSLEITLGHLLLEAAIMFVQCVEAMIWLIYTVDYVGDFFSMFILIYLEGLCGMAYGYWISSISNGTIQANLLCIGGYLPLTLIGGLIWPIEAMPQLLRIFSMFLPCTLPITSFRNVMVKGWSLWHPQVINGAGITILWISIFSISSIWFIKIKN